MGLLFVAEQEGGVFRLRLPGEEPGARVATFLEKQLHTQVEQAIGNHRGAPFVALTLWSRAMYAQFQRADMSDLSLSHLLGFDCEACTRYFLRGAFITAGSVTDPAKTRQVTLSCRDGATARRLSEVLCEVGVPPHSIRRQSGMQLYYKNSVAIEDLFSYLHAHKTLFALINNKIEREIRNEENRATNCVAQNIQKAVKAAAAQTEAIEALQQSREWDKLSEMLRETALLRLSNPDATLSELALLHNPPITKSGLNHRLKKLTELASELKS
jgi:DNA-binding protein WhiA